MNGLSAIFIVPFILWGYQQATYSIFWFLEFALSDLLSILTIYYFGKQPFFDGSSFGWKFALAYLPVLVEWISFLFKESSHLIVSTVFYYLQPNDFSLQVSIIYWAIASLIIDAVYTFGPQIMVNE